MLPTGTIPGDSVTFSKPFVTQAFQLRLATKTKSYFNVLIEQRGKTAGKTKW
jgi:hypothetical protein